MPKQVDYPRASLQKCLELAEAVNDCAGNGTCSTETAADKLNKKVSGAFSALINASVRFQLINNERGSLSTTDLYSKYRLSYDETEKIDNLRTIFLSPPLFEKLYSQFKEKELPVKHLDKMLVREFNTPEAISSRLAKYFIEGAEMCNLIDAENFLMPISYNSTDTKGKSTEEIEKHTISKQSEFTNYDQSEQNIQSYKVVFQGPGMNSSFDVEDDSDFKIIEAFIEKIKTKLNSEK